LLICTFGFLPDPFARYLTAIINQDYLTIFDFLHRRLYIFT
jgi:hypothetical protein